MGGCQELCEVLRRFAEFGGACPKAQSWALGGLANLMVCTENRQQFTVHGDGLDDQGLAHWIHCVLANSDSITEDRQAIGCI